MKFDLKRPCDQCPFLKQGGARVRPARAREIAAADTFVCHKTIDLPTDDRQHCAGHLIHHEKRGHATQMMWIAERLKMYDADALDRSMDDQIVDHYREMVE